MTRILRTLPAAVVVLVLALSGCGGDDESDDSGTSEPTSEATTEAATEATEATSEDAGSSISRDDFITQANAICAAGNEELDAAGADLDPSDPDALAAFATDTLVPNVRAQVEEIRALGFPESDVVPLETVFDETDKVLDAIEADPSLLSSDAFAAVNTVLTGYGLTECGSS